MGTEILNATLDQFISQFSEGWINLKPSIDWLVKILLSIELVLMGLWLALGGGDRLLDVIKKILYLGFWLWIVTEFPMISSAFMKSLVMAGEIAGGGTVSGDTLLNPSRIIRIGFNNTLALAKAMGEQGWDLGGLIVYVFMWLLTMFAYVAIAWQIFYAVLEFYLIVAVVGIFLPFGLLEHTKFLAEKSISSVISSGVKLMVLAFVVTVSEPILLHLVLPNEVPSLESAMIQLLVTGVIAYLAWNAPNVASGLLSGSPSLSAQSAAQMGGQAAGMAAMAAGTIASGGVAATGAAAGAAGSAVKMASAVKTGAEIASSTAAMSGSGGLGSAVAGMKGGAMAAGKGAWNRTGGKVADFVKEQHKQGMAEGFRNTGGSFHKAPGWAADTMNSLQHGKEGEQSSS